MKNKSTITDWLFKPFQFIAGGKALIFGLIVMSLLSVLGYLSNTHFDGVLDIHYDCQSVQTVYLIHLSYQLAAWMLLSVTLFATARIVSKSSIRFIDFAGTAALSQVPLIFAALAGFVPSFHICLGNINQVSLVEINPVLMANIVPLVIIGFISFLFIAWSIVLKYNAYSVSGNIKGVVGVISFAIALLISEILSKMLIYSLYLIFKNIAQ